MKCMLVLVDDTHFLLLYDQETHEPKQTLKNGCEFDLYQLSANKCEKITRPEYSIAEKSAITGENLENEQFHCTGNFPWRMFETERGSC